MRNSYLDINSVYPQAPSADRPGSYIGTNLDSVPQWGIGPTHWAGSSRASDDIPDWKSAHSTNSIETEARQSVISISSTAASTAPTRRRAPLRLPSLGENNSGFVLWCEFAALKGCNTIFHGDDEAAWIQHHAQHLGERFPPELVCWFCDDHPHFFAKRTVERRSNFEERMEHIREHIFGDYMTQDLMRPDFYLIEYMYKHGKLDKGAYGHAMAYSELPESLREPFDDEISSTSKQPCNVQNHDLARENRQRRRGRAWQEFKDFKSGG